MADNKIGQLMGFFGFKRKKSSSGQETVVPTTKKKTKDDKPKVLKLPGYIQRIWDWWISETSDSSETLKDRIERYDSISYMIKNEPIMSMAADMYADESVQADSQSQVINVIAKSGKLKRTIEDLLSRWDMTQEHLRSDAYNLATFGDAFRVNTTDSKKGIVESTQTNPKAVEDRIEFNAIDAKQAMERGTTIFANLSSKDSRLKKLTQIISDSSDVSSYFRSFLFGFQFSGEMFLPPWNVTHFRLYTTEEEYYPFGKSVFVNSISPFRQLRASKNLMAMARAAKFPKEVYEVKHSEFMSEEDTWDAVNEARQEFHNIGGMVKGKDNFAVGGEIWIPEDLIKYSLQENRMNLDDIADVELLRDDMIMGTRIPKGYLIVDRSSFGTSGQSLLQQFKPFGRAVYSVQSALLSEIVQMLRLHFIITGEFEKEFTEFELEMNFPVIEESRDRISARNDSLRLANDVIQNLGQAIGLDRGEALPPDVVKQVFGSLSFLDPEDVERWVDIAVSGKDTDENGTGKSLFDGKKIAESKKINRLYYENNQSRLNEDLINEVYFLSKKERNMKEGIQNHKHYFASWNISREHRYLLDIMRNAPLREGQKALIGTTTGTERDILIEYGQGFYDMVQNKVRNKG